MHPTEHTPQSLTLLAPLTLLRLLVHAAREERAATTWDDADAWGKVHTLAEREAERRMTLPRRERRAIPR